MCTLMSVHSVGSGEWAFDGVEMVSNTSSNGRVVVKCQAMHLTSFAVLVDVSGTLSGVCYQCICNP